MRLFAFVVICLAAATLVAAACLAAEPPAKPGGMVATKVATSPDSLIFEEVWFFFNDKPEEHFIKAKADFDNKALSDAAMEVRTAEAYVKLDVPRASVPAKSRIKQTVGWLEDLAKKMDKGTAVSDVEMQQVFGRVHDVLADDHYQRAASFWQSRELIKAGQEMDAAALHFRHGARWLGQSIDDDAPMLQALHENAVAMEQGKAPVEPNSVDQELRELKTAIDRLAAAAAPVK